MVRISLPSDVAAVLRDVDGVLARFLPTHYSPDFSTALDETQQRARLFALQAHGSQLRGDLPFVTHLDQVAAVLHEFDHDSAIVVGYLHDVIEDTPVTRDEIAEHFGTDVADAVAFCTDEPGPTRRERKQATHARMKRDVARSPAWIGDAVLAKVADRIANVRHCSRHRRGLRHVYRAEHEAFTDALLIPALCDRMWAELDRILGLL